MGDDAGFQQAGALTTTHGNKCNSWRTVRPLIAKVDEDLEEIYGNQEEKEEEEARRPNAIPRPCDPTNREREEHELTHLPFRSWCMDCLRGKAKSLPHRRDRSKEKNEKQVPMIAIDYMYLHSLDVDQKYPIMVVACEFSEATFAHVVTEKGVSSGWIVKRIMEDINSLGYGDIGIIVKSDQEPAITEIQEAVKKERSTRAPTVLINSPVGESQSNGVVERRIQKVQGQIRTLKAAMERK